MTKTLSDPCKAVKQFMDSGCGDGVQFYAYVEYMPSIHQHLVFVNMYESGEYLLIDARDGTETPIQAYPMLSPDGLSFVTASSNPFDIGGHGENGFEIWTLQNAALVRTWTYSIQGWWGPKNPRWLRPDRIEVTQECVDWEAKSGIPVVDRGRIGIVLRDGAWSIEGNDCVRPEKDTN